jgi:hypothetical protein
MRRRDEKAGEEGWYEGQANKVYFFLECFS